MKIVDYLGSVQYQVSGEREEAAAAALEEGLSSVAKRRSAYVQSELDVIVSDVRQEYGVEINVTVS